MSHNLYTINNEGANVFSYHGASKGIIYVGRGESATFPNSTITHGSTLQFYDSNPINTISGASFTQSGNWISEVHLPSGDYEIRASVSMQIATSRFVFYAIYEDSGSGYTLEYNDIFSNRLSSGITNTQRIEPFQSSKIFSFSTATSIRYTMFFEGGTSQSDANNRISETQYLYIRKLA